MDTPPSNLAAGLTPDHTPDREDAAPHGVTAQTVNTIPPDGAFSGDATLRQPATPVGPGSSASPRRRFSTPVVIIAASVAAMLLLGGFFAGGIVVGRFSRHMSAGFNSEAVADAWDSAGPGSGARERGGAPRTGERDQRPFAPHGPDGRDPNR